MQHYAELPDIKRVIVNTHAIEPQVNTLEFCALIYLFDVCVKLYVLKIFATLVSGISRVLWYAFKGMGFGVHEGPSTRQSKRKPSNNRSGEKKELIAYVVIPVHDHMTVFI